MTLYNLNGGEYCVMLLFAMLDVAKSPRALSPSLRVVCLGSWTIFNLHTRALASILSDWLILMTMREWITGELEITKKSMFPYWYLISGISLFYFVINSAISLEKTAVCMQRYCVIALRKFKNNRQCALRMMRSRRLRRLLENREALNE